MIILGMMIGDRYEILDKIGTGGMSDVYKGKDHKLNRLVAVKVLKQEFSENTSFVSKFRTEAQAAAGLMHPNIVNVYDVGEEDGIYYIVMELVEGITLKNYIEKKARLSMKEAISIAIQVSMGIEAAHNNHIIHRDIKPQNIIISKDGKVKVTDFGIAKAATSNTITSNVMGSVHYTSPEQARGGFSDERSDIYSLGCTLFEMLTGHVPFDGETTVAIAIKHIQDDMPSPREYIPEIPISVEKIIFKCTQKSPDRRYQNMSELIADLKKSLLNPDEDFVQMIDLDAQAATRAITEEDMVAIKEHTGSLTASEVHMRLNEDAARAKALGNQRIRMILGEDDEDDEDYEDEVDDTEEEEEEDYEPRRVVRKRAYVPETDDEYDDDDDLDPKMERITTILAIVAAVIIGIIALVLVGKALNMFGGDKDEEVQEETTSQIAMIDVRGMDVDAAKSALTMAGFTTSPEVTYEESDTVKENSVISQDIEPSTMVDATAVLKLVVSSGQGAIAVPNVAGKDEQTARSELEGAGFVVTTETAFSDEIEEGFVIKQSPSGSDKAPEGSTVTLTISSGKEVKTVKVPDLKGKTENDAKTALESAGLKAGTVSEDYSDSVTEGLVISQSRASGDEVEEGSSVNFVLSLGKKAVTYAYKASIDAPTGYENGTEVSITIKSEDGEERHFTTSAFPFNINETGFKSSTGSLNISGKKTVTAEVNTNEDGSAIVNPDGTPGTRTVTTTEDVDFGTTAVTFTEVK
ncbi:MAG: Stk1 family PASTA domain-containing Ser/Thr kinase [Lachnospiraceae bacterium]|nr:Stk1 family PASTA domain-containing Ser/Thr kinase [Lachnospiraceae bacterium]